MATGATATLLAPAQPTTGEAESLLAAMLETVAADGYAGASVARVLTRAGVSRRVFYRHFASREDCFLAAYRGAAAAIGTRLTDAVRASTPRQRPRATVAAMLRAVEEEPAAARTVFLEVLAACPAIRAEHERLLGGVERSIERFLASPGAPLLRVPSTALLGGVCGVLSTRLLAGESIPSADLATDLATWVHSYECNRDDRADLPDWSGVGWPASPAGRDGRMRPTEVQLLPRGRSALPPRVAAGARRDRILAATTRQTAARGYARLTVADIVADARVPRAAFYSHFDSKQDAFLAAQTLGLRESIAAAAAEFATGDTWPERLWRGLAALLDYLAANPDLARLCLLEVHAAGAPAIQRMQENRSAYAIFLADGYRQRPQPPPPVCSEAIVGALEAMVRHNLLLGRAERLPEALPICAHVALVPFIGAERAADWVAARFQAAD